MKLITTAALLTAVAALSGCAVYPAHGDAYGSAYGNVYDNGPVVYQGRPPVYYEPGPYYGSPVYVNPRPIIVERDRDRWDNDHRPGVRPPPRPPQVRPVPPPRPPVVRPGWRERDQDTGERDVRGDSSRSDGNSRFPQGEQRRDVR